LFETISISDLPFIEYDPSYRQRSNWEECLYHQVYSLRFLLSKFPRWPVSAPTVTDEAMKSVNGEIFRSFLRLAREQGSAPIIVFFPSDHLPKSNGRLGLAREVFQAYHIPYLDMTDCVTKVNPAERFVTLHYSPITNAAIARCLRDSIREASR
jgi:hypothetical protein